MLNYGQPPLFTLNNLAIRQRYQTLLLHRPKISNKC